MQAFNNTTSENSLDKLLKRRLIENRFIIKVFFYQIIYAFTNKTRDIQRK